SSANLLESLPQPSETHSIHIPENPFCLIVPRSTLSSARTRAFTLVELMVVIAIMVAVAAFIAPAFTSLKSAGDVTSAAYTIKGVLDQARTYAMANNTYTWVGFYEEDASQPSTNPATPGIGRVVLSIV